MCWRKRFVTRGKSSSAGIASAKMVTNSHRKGHKDIRVRQLFGTYAFFALFAVLLTTALHLGQRAGFVGEHAHEIGQAGDLKYLDVVIAQPTGHQAPVGFARLR
jgi:hypothetical protein